MTGTDALRATRLLAGLRLRRLRNMISAYGLRRYGKAAANPVAARSATPAKAGIGWLLMSGVTLLMAFTFASNTHAFLLALYCHLSPACDGSSALTARQIAAALRTTTFSDVIVRGLTMMMSLLWLLSVIYPFSLAVRAGPDWDLEWIATLPMSRTTLLGSRILERAISNPTGWFLFAVVGGVIAWHANAGWLTPLYALLITLPLLLFTSSIWTILDFGLHILLAPGSMRNLQAVSGLMLGPVVYLVMSMGSPTGRHYALMLTDHTPQWMIWTPPGVTVQMLSAPFGPHAPGLYGLLLVEVALITLASLAFLRFQLRAGLASHGARESGRSSRNRTARDHHGRTTRRVWLSPVKRHELTLLLRDRRYLVQGLGLPLVMILGQFMFNGGLGLKVIENPAVAASAAFSIGAYTLVQTAMQTLITEGNTLWLLYTFPRSISSVLLEKARFYGFLALPYPLICFAVSLTLTHLPLSQYLVDVVLVLLGLPIYAVIALSLGVLSGSPTGTTGRQLGIRYVYLFMGLTGFYIYALYSHAWWPRLTTPVLCAALAYALWQKSCDRMPYLLDSAAAPPSRVSLADGLIAAMLFFVLQFVAAFLLKGSLHIDGAELGLLAYVCAGAVTYLLMRAAFWSLKTHGVPRVVASRAVSSAFMGAAVGVICGIAGLIYLWLAKHFGFAPDTTGSHSLTPGARAAIAALTVCAAPVFEEFIFRGLIFGGVRRSLKIPVAATGSALLFAIVHPPFSMVPVFVLGLGTAWVYERRKMLLASMMTHAAYNAIVVGYFLATANG